VKLLLLKCEIKYINNSIFFYFFLLTGGRWGEGVPEGLEPPLAKIPGNATGCVPAVSPGLM
jgi:hypothetical protein